MSKIRDERTRKEFIKYLDEHPDDRFFQAIRNFTYYHISPATHIYARDGVDGEYKDTFYWPCDEMLKGVEDE